MKKSLIFLALVLMVLDASAGEKSVPQKTKDSVKRGEDAAGRGIVKGEASAGRGLKKGGNAVGKRITKAGEWIGKKTGAGGKKTRKAKE